MTRVWAADGVGGGRVAAGGTWQARQVRWSASISALLGLGDDERVAGVGRRRGRRARPGARIVRRREDRRWRRCGRAGERRGRCWGVRCSPRGRVFRGAGGGADDEFAVADLGLEGVGGPLAVVGQRRVVDGAPAVPVGLVRGFFWADWATTGRGSAARRSAEAVVRENRIGEPSRVV
jgi:hypothetical protein